MLTLILSVFFLNVCHAEHEAKLELAQAPSALSKPVELVGCKPPPSGFKNKVFPEPVVEQAAKAANLSKVEVLARLVYSETLSTGFWNKRCNADSPADMMTNIAGGIMYRVSKQPKGPADPYYATVFAKGQFSTSFYNEKAGGNPFAKAFLCPLSIQSYLPAGVSAEKLYAEAQKIAEDMVAAYNKEGLPKKFSRLTNFFYPRSEYYGEIRPPWAPNADPKKNRGYVNLLKKENPCVEFYEL